MNESWFLIFLVGFSTMIVLYVRKQKAVRSNLSKQKLVFTSRRVKPSTPVAYDLTSDEFVTSHVGYEFIFGRGSLHEDMPKMSNRRDGDADGSVTRLPMHRDRHNDDQKTTNDTRTDDGGGLSSDGDSGDGD